MFTRASSVFAFLLFATVAFAFQGPRRQEPINVQVLKGMSDSKIRMTMDYVAASLGVRCSHCHVSDSSGWHWDRDDKATKRTARKMMQMVIDLNSKNFGGRSDVTCFTCHRGSTEPASVMPLPQPAPAPRREEAAAPPSLPAAEAVMAMYENAIGGAGAIGKITNRVTTGVSVDWQGKENPMELAQEPPSKVVTSITNDRGTFAHGYDGTRGWTSSPRGSRELPAEEGAELKKDAALFPLARMRELAGALHVRGKETLAGATAYVLAAPAGGDATEQFYVDSASGLLLRSATISSTPIGDIPEQTDYSDYRAVDGVKVPFRVQSASADAHDASTFRISEVKQNVSLDEKKFSMPKGKK